MFKKLFASALFAGLGAAVVATLLQVWLIVPLIQKAELYETGALVHFAGGADPAPNVMPTDTAEKPTEASMDLVRNAKTFFMDFVVFAGFAFILGAVVAALGKNDDQMTLRDGLLWGLAGFTATLLAPALGLPPELPGIPAADMLARQTWWIGTILATSVALGLFAFGKSAPLIAVGVVLLLVPHIIGAPHLPEYAGLAPPELATLFSARSLGVGAAAWAVLGLVFASTWSRIKAA